jgi:glyoxylase-like metal-dependent hydrolase (beta-lactamase superfamily II)
MEFERHTFDHAFGSVNVYRVGDTLVDTGHVMDSSREAIAAALDDGPLAGVDRVVLTHPHTDHVGGSQTVPELAALPHTVYEGVPEVLTDFSGYHAAARAQLRRRSRGLDVHGGYDASYFPDGDYAEDDIDVASVVSDGETVRLGPYECEAVFTPGHSAAHMALWHADSTTLFSADLVSRNGHFMHGPLDADIGTYRDSLRRIRQLDADRLVPGHGPPMDDPRARIDDALEKSDAAADGLRAAVEAAGGPVPASDLAREVFGATDATVGFLLLVACDYLEYLDAEGDVDYEIGEEGPVARPSG